MTDVSVRPASGVAFDAEAEVLIIGAGAAGLVAALAAREAGTEPVVMERDAVPRGSTALSAGLVPAAGTRWQRAANIDDDPHRFAADILRKTKGRADRTVLALATQAAADALHWLADRHGLPFLFADDVVYPGHSVRRMHGLPTRSGQELVDRLRAAAEAVEVPILTEAAARTLFLAEDGRTIAGVGLVRPDGTEERIACRSLVLACNGYGGNRELVRRHIPELADALWFGHDGNRGEALLWGEALGAELRHLSGHQGHGNVAHPHGILITWTTIMLGGIQVNAAGERFSDETDGYSEQAARVLAQPGGFAWTVFDERIAHAARAFADYRASARGGCDPARRRSGGARGDAAPAAGAACGHPRRLQRPGSFRARLERDTLPSPTLLRGSRDRRSVPHARGARHRRRLPRTAPGRRRLPKPVRCRWCGGWRLRPRGLGLPFGQRASHRHRARPNRRPSRGLACARDGNSRAFRTRDVIVALSSVASRAASGARQGH